MLTTMKSILSGTFSNFAQLAAIVLILSTSVYTEDSIASSDCVPLTLSVPGTYGGSVDINGDFCVSSASGTITMTYNNFTGLPGFYINGQLQSTFGLNDLQNPTALTISLTGGPITAAFDGESYSVTFDNLHMSYGLTNFQAISVSGGVYVNGQYIPASTAIAEIMF